MLGLGTNFGSLSAQESASSNRFSYPTETNAYAVNFDGSNDRSTSGSASGVNSMTHELNGTNWSLQFYFKTATAGSLSNGFFLWKASSFSTYFRITLTNGSLGVTSQGVSGGGYGINTTFSTNCAVNTWYHIILTSDGSGTNRLTKCYLDGSLVTTTSQSDIASSKEVVPSSGNPGFANLAGFYHFEYTVDQWATWSEALSAAEVLELSTNTPDLTQNAGNYISSSRLQRYYKMDEGSGTSLADSSGNNRTALTLVNGPTFTTNTPF
mgnify:CR=1 FL=1|tara:strand:+ start:34 stop:834 length:801 start_codon:yes stop_codon:yes gene_type:complete